MLNCRAQQKSAARWDPIEVDWSDKALAVACQREDTRHNMRRTTYIHDLQGLQEFSPGQLSLLSKLD